MEFWGVEVKSGKPLKVQPEFGKLIHISQAALGEVKDVKGAKHVPLRLKIDDKDFIIGSLAAEDRTQLMFDLVFEKEFELSHDWKNGSVYFIGYIADDPVSDGEDYSDLSEGDSEDEPVEAHKNCNHDHKPVAKVKTEVSVDVATKAAAPAKAGAKKVEQPDSDDEVDSDFGSSDDEMLPGEEDDSSDFSGEGSEEEGDESEEELPKQSKKRPAEAAQKTPVPSKKVKSATPDKTGNKKGHTATPFPSKAAGKTPAGSAKSNGQTPKSGSQLTCQSCTKTFTSQNALLSHSKAKHGGK